MMRLLAAILFAIIFVAEAVAGQIVLKPHKDKLFAYPKVLESGLDGRYLSVDYIKARDIYERDAIPLRKVKNQYVNFGLGFSRRARSYRGPNGKQKFMTIGKYRRGAKVTVIYLHGQGGNRHQGVNDWTFGGNFNRLQTLMKDNGGVLVTPDYTDFKERGTADIAALMREFKSRSPSTIMIIACGSMGGGVCWRLAKTPETAAMMDGMFILGSHWHDDFLTSSTARKGGRHVPIFFGHGSWDPVFDPKVQRSFFEKLIKQTPNYPARFVMFNTGKHGTPIRMVDWRRELNWMLSLHR